VTYLEKASERTLSNRQVASKEKKYSSFLFPLSSSNKFVLSFTQISEIIIHKLRLFSLSRPL
jgi:hypothetical protein